MIRVITGDVDVTGFVCIDMFQCLITKKAGSTKLAGPRFPNSCSNKMFHKDNKIN
nr:MAG TPA: hypothetical protein [Caudoviricetes sp.]